MIISSSERPNIDCGSSRFSQFRERSSSGSGGAISPAPVSLMAGSFQAGPLGTGSLGLEGISGAAHGLQIERIARIRFDLASQTGHLHIDIADVAAERGGLRQILARDRLAGGCGERGEQPCLGACQMHELVAAKQLVAVEIEAE